MSASSLLIDSAEGIATVTVNRPEKLNALNSAVIAELTTVFERFRDDAALRAVILTGAGEKAFIAGADIAELARLGPAEARENARKGQALTALMEGLGKPVLAAINGFALGGGCELALACAVRVAAEGARLGQPEVKLGLICGYGGTQRLARLVGRGKALELLLTGETVDAAEALRIGLVNKVVPRAALLDETRALARRMLAGGPVALKYTLRAVYAGLDVSLEESLNLEAELFGRCFETQDMKEGTSAFLEKRPPNFTGH